MSGLGIWVICATATTQAFASPETDRSYSLQTLGYLKAHDNIDGLFVDYVAVSYKDYFAKQSRFTVTDLGKADSVLSRSSIPYFRLIEDKEILGQIARTTRTESLIRTKIYKEGPRYRFTIDWLHSPRMDVLASETFVLQEPNTGKAFTSDDIRKAIFESLDRAFSKVPFKGQVTGRDNQSVTVNISTENGIKKGDILVVSTLDEVKKHPLLKNIVDWRMSQTGKLVVDQVEDGTVFCKVAEEEAGRNISRFQKITQIIPVATDPKKDESVAKVDEEVEWKEELSQPAKLGWSSLGLWMGSYGRDYATQSSTFGRAGAGFHYGVLFESQLWLTRQWFGELIMGVGGAGYGQTDLATGAPTPSLSGGASTLNIKLGFGYTIFASPDFFGPRAWIKLGYQSLRFGLPVDATELTGPNQFSNLYLGVGGELPFRGDWGALLGLDVGIFNGMTETGLNSGTVNSASAVTFFIGGYKQIQPRLKIRGGLHVTTGSADFSSGTSVSHRIISVLPSLQYYF
ncbi:MAG: hypothetical protein JNL01_09195 [Bdellovibrionales bacterium]|nr:hypothetical protein [Bdellovibrionales bacterium]